MGDWWNPVDDWNTIVSTVQTVEDIGEIALKVGEYLAEQGIFLSIDLIKDIITMCMQIEANPLEEIPQLVRRIEQFGGDVVHILQQMIDGIAQYGLGGYIEHLYNRAVVDPMKAQLNSHAQTAQNVANIHLDTMQGVTSRLNPLFGGQLPTSAAPVAVPPSLHGQHVQFSGKLANTVAETHGVISGNLLSMLSPVNATTVTSLNIENADTQLATMIGNYTVATIALIVVVDLLIIAANTVVVVLTDGTTAPILLPAAGPEMAAADTFIVLMMISSLLLQYYHSVNNLFSTTTTTVGTTSATQVATTTHQASITLVGGGASNGGQTVVVNGDGTTTDVGGLTIGVQRATALDAAWDCDVARADYNNDNPKLKGNFNTAIGYAWLVGGRQEIAGPEFGVLAPPTHSEPKIIVDWQGQIPMLSAQLGSHLMLLLFTRNPMCGVCQSKVPLWNQQLAAVAGAGVTVHFYVWESFDPRNDVGPWNIQQVSLP